MTRLLAAAKDGSREAFRELFPLVYSELRRLAEQLLVDHARTRHRLKRGGDARSVALDEALDRLAERDQGKARLVELRLFAGLCMSEVSDFLGVSLRTCEQDWTLARLAPEGARVDGREGGLLGQAREPLPRGTNVARINGQLDWNGTKVPAGGVAVLLLSARPGYLGDGCGLLVDTATMLPFPFLPPRASWSFGLGIPNDPSLKGVKLVSQVAYVRSVAAVVKIDFTNAAPNILGS